MNAKVRRRIEMGRQVAAFGRDHPDDSAGYVAMSTRMDELLARADVLADQQLDGFHAVRAATTRKYELRRVMKSAHLGHIVGIAQIAAREVPELAQKFVLPERGSSYLAFRTTARTLAAEAVARKDVLIRYGLAEKVLDDLLQAITQFDQAIEQGTNGRRAHVAASAELETLSEEIVQLVKGMHGLNRFRFSAAPELLAAWESASNVMTVSPARPAAGDEIPPAESEVKPAA
jgi:hypothetical protein